MLPMKPGSDRCRISTKITQHFDKGTHHSATFAGSAILLPHGRIEEDGSWEEFSSLTEIPGGSRMERQLTEERGGGIKKEKEDPETERMG